MDNEAFDIEGYELIRIKYPATLKQMEYMN